MGRLLKWKEAKAIYSELAIPRKSAFITCILVETQRHAKEWESFKVKKWRGFLGVFGCYWHGESVDRLTRSKTYYVIS